jgi:hypothetical protein
MYSRYNSKEGGERMKKAISRLSQVLITIGLAFVCYKGFLMTDLVQAQIVNPSMQTTLMQGGLTPLEAPCISSATSWAEGTNEVMIRSSFTSAGTNVSQGVFSSAGNAANQPAGPGYITWIALSTGAPTDNLIIRDTGTLGNTANNLQIFPPIQFSTYTQVGAGIGYNPTLAVITFSPPVRFNNGITMQMQGTGKTRATICYRNYGSSNP